MTGKPADPTVVIEGVNNTQVQLVWNFTASSSSFVVSIRRKTPTGSTSQIASLISGSSSGFNVFDSAYEANLPATLVIKNVTRNDEYVYSISVLNLDAGGVEVLLSNEVAVDLLCKSELVFCVFFQFILRSVPATTVPIDLCKGQLSVFSICDFLIICLPNATGGFVPY